MTHAASIATLASPDGPGSPEIMLDQAELARGGMRVLGPLSLHLPVRRLGIIGRNGSGKSSLLRLLSGLSPPSAGRVRIAGIDPATDRAAAIRTVGILFQNPDHQIIFPTVNEELAFGLEQIGLTRSAAAARVAASLARHGRTDWGPRQVHSLSEGQRRWLCLMAVLAMGPRVLLLDEPFAGLDIPTVTALEAEFAALPLALVTITHDPAHLTNYDHILWLEGGLIAAQGHPDAVLPDYLAEMRRLGGAGPVLTLAIPGPSWAHRLGAGPKLGALAIMMIAVLQVTSLPALGLALAGIAALYASLGPRAWRPGLEGLRPLIWLAVLVVVFHAVFADVVTGVAMALRIFVMVGLANFITLTTPMAEMIAVVTRIAAPLRHIGLDPRALALSMALFLRYIPVLRARATALAMAWRARSQRRPGVRIIVPLVLSALDDADQLADALRARGGISPQPTHPLGKGTKE